MLKAITFDLDNTLIDFMKLKKYASYAAAKAMVKAGLHMNAQQCKKELYDFYLTDIEGDKVFENFLSAKGQNTEIILAAAINAYRMAKQKHLKPYHNVPKTLRKLKQKGLKLAIVSDAPKLKACLRLDALGIIDYFDVVVGFEDTQHHKDSGLPFRKALQILHVNPSEVMHVGDWPERDILGAAKQGMITCWAKYGSDQKTAHADFKIDTFEDLLKIVSKI